ncbi:MAG: hypothetical protein LBP79_06900 [Clostridiales bacterium]|jgi:hypothetical protein|nr:hypothetical protein [Clostridiales bacterium]
MEKIRKNTFQALALEAKNRLKHGYWNEIKEKRKQTEPSDRNKKRAAALLTKEEEAYYVRVKKILAESAEADAVVINPIGRLIDKKYYAELSAEEKQQYVFRLSEIYISIKKKISNGANCAASM